MLKETLQQLVQMNVTQRQHYLAEHGDALVPQMLAEIGTLDNELRDQLNYRVFIECADAGLWTSAQLQYVAKIVASEPFLYFHLNEEGGDAVFTRSFSALWLTALLQVDRQQAFLTPSESQQIIETAVHYIQREHDVRGFTGETGWAHAIAHGADLAVACIQHPSFEEKFAPICLQGIKEAFWKGTVYVDDEDERLSAVIQALIATDFPEEVLIEWVEQVFDKLERYRYEVGYTPELFMARTNTMHFMKTLYFALKFSNHYLQLRGVCSIFIGKWMKF